MNNVTLLFDREIQIAVPLKGYRLIPGFEGQGGLPMEAFLRLFAVNEKGDRAKISGPSDLSPLVAAVRNEREAWSFFRLFTGASTHYLFRTDTYVVDVQIAVSRDIQSIGDISAEGARKAGLTEPELTHKDSEYSASRDLLRVGVRNSNPAPVILRRREAISETGKYRFIEDAVVAEVSRTDVLLPNYE